MKMNLKMQSILVLTLMLNACGKENVNTIIERGSSSGKQVLADEAMWNSDSAPIGNSGTIFTKTLSESGRQIVKKELKETSLESLNLPSDLNVNAFTISSKENSEAKKSVYIAPKIYLYPQSDRFSKVKVHVSGDNVLIPLHAIFIDGLSDKIFAANGIDKIATPPNFLVKKDKLDEALESRGFSKKVQVGPLDGCPQKIVLAAGGESFDVTPADLSEANQCELNRPFTLNLVVPKAKADFIINEALYYNEVDVYAFFEVLVGYVNSEVRVQLDRSEVFEKLSASLTGKYPPYAEGTLQTTLKTLLKNETLNVRIKGDKSEVINKLVDIAMTSMTEKFELTHDQKAASSECKEAVCFNLSYNKDIDRKYLELNYQQFSTTLTGQMVNTHAVAQQILFPEVVLSSSVSGNEDVSNLSDSDINYVSNLGTNYRDLAISVNRGTVIDIDLTNVSQQIDNTSVGVSIQRAHSAGARDFWGNVRFEVYTNTVSRNYLGTKFSKWSSVAGNDIGKITSNLFLKMRKSNGLEIQCSLEQMEANSTGDRISVKLENTPNCKIFDSQDGEFSKVNLSFVNGLKSETKLKRIGNGSAYRYDDKADKIGSEPSMDESQLGGPSPKKITEVEREIRLAATIRVKQYDRY